MADRVVKISVSGPRASGVTQTVELIRKTLKEAGLVTHKGVIKYAITDESSGEIYSV